MAERTVRVKLIVIEEFKENGTVVDERVLFSVGDTMTGPTVAELLPVIAASMARQWTTVELAASAGILDAAPAE